MPMPQDIRIRSAICLAAVTLLACGLDTADQSASALGQKTFVTPDVHAARGTIINYRPVIHATLDHRTPVDHRRPARRYDGGEV